MQNIRRAATLIAQPISQQLGFSGQPLAVSTIGFSKSRSISTTVFAAQDRHGGSVKWFNSVKGYGFIVPKDGTPDLFVHQSSILSDGFRSLAEGEEVEYDLGEDQNGRPRATNVSGPNGQPPIGQPRQESSFGGGDRYGGGGGGGRGGYSRGGGGGGGGGGDNYY